MGIFGCDLLIAECCEQFLKATTAIATSDIPCICNGLLATVYFRRSTCNGNFHLIEIIVAPSCMRYEMKTYENLSSMMKTVGTLDEDWPIYQGITSNIFSMMTLLLQAI